MDAKSKQPWTAPFTVIAMKDVKDKKTDKQGTLGDLFKCVESLVSSHESLQSYAESVAASGGTSKERLDVLLKQLGQVEQGLIELAQERISSIGSVAAPAAPAEDQSKAVPPPPEMGEGVQKAAGAKPAR